ncbi:unnamed protein product [Rotaria sordida]|uniref:Uncharacterized protein n=1 Tax=Rotaria sordida TaxID=392033 RepID=A0A818Y1L1_9BILA|nr:unnamed protein product [Rotaria sordida]CAF3744097.1 unnamed protein product [Rotaria sordida]
MFIGSSIDARLRFICLSALKFVDRRSFIVSSYEHVAVRLIDMCIFRFIDICTFRFICLSLDARLRFIDMCTFRFMDICTFRFIRLSMFQLVQRCQ